MLVTPAEKAALVEEAAAAAQAMQQQAAQLAQLVSAFELGEEKPRLGRASVGQRRLMAAFAGELRAQDCLMQAFVGLLPAATARQVRRPLTSCPSASASAWSAETETR